jgi:hypothetical protein
MLIMLLLILEPPRLAKTRMEMKPKILWRRAILLHRLPQPTLKIKVQRKRGSAQKTWLPRVPRFQKNASEEPAAARDSELQMFELLES